MKPSQAPDRSLSGVRDVWLICSPTSFWGPVLFLFARAPRRLGHLVELTFGGTKHISPLGITCWKHAPIDVMR